MSTIQKHTGFIFTLLTWIFIVIFTFLYMTLIFSTNVWTDEAFTLQTLKHNIPGIIEYTARDVHPPLYYLYAKVFYKIFGPSLPWQKIATIIPMVLTYVYAATIIRKAFNPVTSFLFVLFMGCIPCSMEFTVQIRMYTLALFVVTVSGFEAYLAFCNRKNIHFVICGLCGLAAAYTHYFAFVSAVFIFGFLLIAILVWKRDLILKWTLTGLCMIIGYIPWMPYFFKQVTSVEAGYWIPEITGDTVWEFFTWTFDLRLVWGTVFVFIIMLKALGTVNTCRLARKPEQEDIYAVFCMLVPTCTCIAGVIASYIKTPIYRDQYIFPSLGLLALYFAIILGKSKKTWIALCCAFLIFVGFFQYKESYAQEYTSTYWPQTKKFLDENMGENDYILYNYKDFDFIYECHFPPEKLAYFETFNYQSDYDVLWYLDTNVLPGLNESYTELYGLQMEYMGVFGIEHNPFDIYKVTKKK